MLRVQCSCCAVCKQMGFVREGVNREAYDYDFQGMIGILLDFRQRVN